MDLVVFSIHLLPPSLHNFQHCSRCSESSKDYLNFIEKSWFISPSHVLSPLKKEVCKLIIREINTAYAKRDWIKIQKLFYFWIFLIAVIVQAEIQLP